MLAFSLHPTSCPFHLSIRVSQEDLGLVVQGRESKAHARGISFLPPQVTSVPMVSQPSAATLPAFVSAFLIAGPKCSNFSLARSIRLQSDTLTWRLSSPLGLKTQFTKDTLKQIMETKIKESSYLILNLINQLFSLSPIPFPGQGHRHIQFLHICFISILYSAFYLIKA